MMQSCKEEHRRKETAKCYRRTKGHGNALDKAEELNELFANVGKRTYERTQSQLSHKNLDQGRSRHNAVHEHLIQPEPVDTNTIILTLKHLKKINSVGSDGISLEHLRDSLTVIAHYLTTIITLQL